MPLQKFVARWSHEPANRQCLFRYEGSWYRSPMTTAAWSWTAGTQVVGTYEYSSGSCISAFNAGVEVFVRFAGAPARVANRGLPEGGVDASSDASAATSRQ